MKFAEVSENGMAENLKSAAAELCIKADSAKIKIPEQSESIQIKSEERQKVIIADLEKEILNGKGKIKLLSVVLAMCICLFAMLSVFGKVGHNVLFIFGAIIIVVINIIILCLCIANLFENKEELKFIRLSLCTYERLMRKKIKKRVVRGEGLIIG